MKVFYCAYLLLALCSAVDISWMDAPKHDGSKFFYLKSFLHEASAAFKDFKSQYNRIYESVKEEEQRFIAFVENFVYVKKMNALYEGGNITYKVGINRFSDMNDTERKQFRGYRPALKQSLFSYSRGATFLGSAVNLTLPSEVDWRRKNAVTGVKDQGRCGSCYAFSSTGSLEGQHFRKFGRLVSLSEQQIVDCSARYGNNGCNGGIMDSAFRYIKDNNGIDTEAGYPYKSGKTGRGSAFCHYNASYKGAEDVGFVDILPSGDEEKLKEAVASVGPISVAIDASQSGFMQYTDGVYEDDYCSNAPGSLDHAVLVVGYGTEQGTPYWLVKNSWAPTWGRAGYIKMRRNADNMCGIATMASYPLV